MLCQLCESEAATSFHHLIPRALHSNRWFKRRFTRERMSEGLNVCRLCHRTIHATIAEKTLGRHFNTRDELLAHPELAKYVAWRQRRARMS